MFRYIQFLIKVRKSIVKIPFNEGPVGSEQTANKQTKNANVNYTFCDKINEGFAK